LSFDTFNTFSSYKASSLTKRNVSLEKVYWNISGTAFVYANMYLSTVPTRQGGSR